MKNFLLSMALAAAALSGCMAVSPEAPADVDKDGKDMTAEGVLDGSSGLYVTAISFDEGYDWQRDTAFGLAYGRLEVYKMDKLMLSIPAGKGTEVSLDPDKHHLIDGHIYTEYTYRDSTVIKRDGKEFLRYDTAESIKGIIIRDEDFFTLGQHIGGKGGLSLRRNGIALVENDTGFILGSFADPSYLKTGALYEDNGIMYFSFYTSFSEDSPTTERHWYLVKNQTISEVWLEKDITEIYDMRMIGGKLCRIVTCSVNSGPIMDIGGTRFSLSRSLEGGIADDYRLVDSNGLPYMVGSYYYLWETKPRYSALWSPGGSKMVFEGRLLSICTDSDGVTSFILGGNDGRVNIAQPSGYGQKLSGEVSFISPACSAFHDGEVYVLFRPGAVSDKPYLWSRKGILEYDINGMLTSVSEVK